MYHHITSLDTKRSNVGSKPAKSEPDLRPHVLEVGCMINADLLEASEISTDHIDHSNTEDKAGDDGKYSCSTCNE